MLARTLERRTRAVLAAPTRAGASRALAATMLLAYPAADSAAACAVNWPLWQRFATRFIQADGRVINYDTRGQESISEAQAYALFLALVANDPAMFARLLTWTRDNLAGGDLTARLPAWQWGRKPDGSWGVLDANSAADADLWLAYSLLEAGRLWGQSSYTALGKLLAMQIEKREVVELRGVGPMLIPGAKGFQLEDGWRLNPSYMPLPLLRRLALDDPSGPWDLIAANTVKLVAGSSPAGLAPDWAVWTEGRGFSADPQKGDAGSFDAIRVYLWAGMTHPGDPLRAGLLEALGGMARALEVANVPPRSVRAGSGESDGDGPLGFSAALLPYLTAIKRSKLVAAQELRVAALAGGASALPGYYDSVLLAFGKGWTENRFRFDKQGRLIPQWRQACDSPRKSSSRH